MNAEQFTQLYSAHEKLVSSEVYSGLRDKEAVEDVCQDVWLSAWRSRDTYDPDKAKPSTWLVAIVKQCIDRHLRDYVEHQPEVVSDSSLTAVIDGEVVDGSWIENVVPAGSTAEEDQLLAEFMMRAATLSEQETAIFNLVYWHGLSYAAAASRLGISPDTVGPIVGRLRDKLEVKDLYHKAFTYHAPGAVWGDWAWKPTGVGNLRMENNNNGTNSSGHASAGFRKAV